VKIREDSLDKAVYIIACICSCGAIWVLRVMISMAIRKAGSND